MQGILCAPCAAAAQYQFASGPRPGAPHERVGDGPAALASAAAGKNAVSPAAVVGGWRAVLSYAQPRVRDRDPRRNWPRNRRFGALGAARGCRRGARGAATFHVVELEARVVESGEQRLRGASARTA